MPSPALLAPSVLSADFSELRSQLAQAEAGGADWLHLDVMDGHFVPNITFGPFIAQAVRKATPLFLDCHLMIEEPDRYLKAFAESGVGMITVHQEACRHLDRTIAEIRRLGCRAGVSLNPATPPEVLEWVLPSLDMVLVMSVNPGFGGQKFLPYSLEKIRRLRRMVDSRGLATRIEVDGGIGPDNVSEVIAAGADTIVAGSAVFGAPDIAGACRLMKQRMALQA